MSKNFDIEKIIPEGYITMWSSKLGIPIGWKEIKINPIPKADQKLYPDVFDIYIIKENKSQRDYDRAMKGI